MSCRLLVVVQARMGSGRFPGKVLHPLLGQPMILWVLDRVSRLPIPHTLIVALPATKDNDPLELLCTRHGYACSRPNVSEEDVLGRFATVAQEYDAQNIVRICADCPTIDPLVIAQLCNRHEAEAGNVRPGLTAIAAEWPDGMDIEIIDRAALDKAAAKATSLSDLAHVTPYIWRNYDKFECATLPCPLDLSAICWSVDTQNDLECVGQLIKRTMQRTGLNFDWRDLWATMVLHPLFLDTMGKRRVRNQAYVEEVARENPAKAGQDWTTLRYGSPTSPNPFFESIP